MTADGPARSYPGDNPLGQHPVKGSAESLYGAVDVFSGVCRRNQPHDTPVQADTV